MDAVACIAEERLRRAGIQLTLGGEPTVVPFDPVGPEWTVAADGSGKLEMARRLARELQQRAWPGSTLMFCPGKRYEGEVNPRWALRLISGTGGQPPVRWPEPCQPGLRGRLPRPEEGPAWLAQLGRQLGTTLEPLPLRDPLDPRRRVWAVPLSAELLEPAQEAQGADAEAALRWLPAAWELAEERRELSGAPGPAGLRLPLEHLPEDIPRQVLTLEIDPEGWELFLPPLIRRPLQVLLQAIADSLTDDAPSGNTRADLSAPRLSGVLPVDATPHWQVLGLTADPGVLEINLPVCHGWAEYHGWLQLLEQLCDVVGLRSWKPGPDGWPLSTGGGNHLLWGGPDLARHPFFCRPAWLVGILRYWQHHPSLSYLFCGASVGPASQSPRPDEVAGTPFFDLELAYRCLEQADDGRDPDDPRGDHRVLIGETLRHLHADNSGNNHRSEISFDKFWNPAAPGGCQGLLEFRALESLPDARWSSAVALLWSALAAHLLDPVRRPDCLRDWGTSLHDRLLLPSQLWADLETVLADLSADGLVLEPEIYRRIWDWRFPLLLQWRQNDWAVEIRPALEPWPLICDTPLEGGFTSRFVDASLRRLEIRVSEAMRREGMIVLQGRPLPLAEPLLAVRYRHQRLYPCLHPAIEPQLPLRLELRTPAGVALFRLTDSDTHFQPWSGADDAQLQQDPGASAWGGRIRPRDVTLDLRLD